MAGSRTTNEVVKKNRCPATVFVCVGWKKFCFLCVREMFLLLAIEPMHVDWEPFPVTLLGNGTVCFFP